MGDDRDTRPLGYVVYLVGHVGGVDDGSSLLARDIPRHTDVQVLGLPSHPCAA